MSQTAIKNRWIYGTEIAIFVVFVIIINSKGERLGNIFLLISNGFMKSLLRGFSVLAISLLIVYVIFGLFDIV